MLKIPGAGQGSAFLLRHGQVAKVGRTEWADFCIPHDETLAEFQFALQCGCDRATLTDLQSGTPTLVNGKAVTDTTLQHGDQIRAGETTFLVELSGTVHDTCTTDSEGVVEATATEPVDLQEDEGPALPETLQDWCAVMELSEEAEALLGKERDGWAYVRRLADAELFGDALRVAGILVPVQQTVAWGAQMVQETLGELTGLRKFAMEAAHTWIADPSEAHRRKCEEAAQASDFDGPASWVALGAFWSGGSMGPVGQPEVPAPPGLAAKAIAGALMMSATREPLAANATYRRYLATLQDASVKAAHA